MSDDKTSMEQPRRASDALSGLSPAQRKLLEFRLKKKEIRATTLTRIPHRPQDSEVELSLAQERFWFLEQLEGDSGIYNRGQAFRMVGDVETWALQQSLNAILARHETLRMAIPAIDGKPAPRIEPSLTVELSVTDITSLSDSSKEAVSKKIAAEEAKAPFDLATPPFLRARLIRLSKNEHVLVLVSHHIVSDAWSDAIFWGEFEELYNSLISGDPYTLQDLPIQYSDFASWQRRLLLGETQERDLRFWKQQLGRSSPVLKLPIDHRKNTDSVTQPTGATILIENHLVAKLRILGQHEDITLFMTMLAAFLSLLHRLSGQDDIFVGTTMAGRDRVELEGLVGVFVKTLVLRTDVSGDPSFLELLRRVRKVALSAYDHQDLPFERLLEELNPERNLHRTPLFQAYFNFRNLPKTIPSLAGLKVERFEFDYGAPLFQVEFNVSEREDGLSCQLRCDATLFEENTSVRMLSQYRVLLEAVVERPDCALSELPLMNFTEQRLLLEEWSGTKPSNGVPVEPVQCLIERQARMHPAKAAVVCESSLVTYSQLDDRANGLAEELKKQGIGPGVIVAVCLDRSIELITAILGIFKSGGVYLPLDPDNPQERLNFVINDAQPAVILTQVDYLQKMKALPSVSTAGSDFQLTIDGFAPLSLVCLDLVLPETLSRLDENPEGRLRVDDPAYVIYTSGSTGRPKGVMVSQHALGSYGRSATEVYGIRSEDRFLQFSSLSFDASMEEIFCCLTAGGTLVLRTESMLESPAIFLHKCQEWDITVLSLPTTYWHELAAQLEIERLSFPSCLRLVIIGGERARPDRLENWCVNVPPGVQLINSYGPTEATVVATTWEADTSLEAVRSMAEVPIGRPLPHVQAYVLDKALQPVPIGAPGELFLGGAGLARGYLNHPELTAEKFVTHPYSTRSGERLYRTGDRVRYRPDGNLEFLGRFDQQVKLRGYRVELGEIETVLTLHPGVRSTTVQIWADPNGEERLAAHIVVDRMRPPSINELRRFLQTRLPDYMVPAQFVFLDALPVTSSGKIDRMALPFPAPEETRRSNSPGLAPRTPFEEKVAEVWVQTLELKKVDINQNFFDLGGHSLKAIQVVSRLRTVFQVDLSLRRFFSGPTIAELALAILEELVKKSELEPQP